MGRLEMGVGPGGGLKWDRWGSIIEGEGDYACVGSGHPHGKREISIMSNGSISGQSWFVIYLVLNVKDSQD